jgi:hypothetical protein
MLSKRYLNALYSFEGLAAFKAKFRPDGWEEIYLVGMSGITPRMLLAVLVAFTRSRPAQFAVSSLRRLMIRWLRRIEPVTWRRISYGFAVTLVMWIVLLARVDSIYWFGTADMRDTWIAFDCLMVVLFVLLGTGAGRRRSFASSLALVGCGAALADSFLTTMQAIHFHILRGLNIGEFALWLVAVSGPLLAGSFLIAVAVGLRGRNTTL